MENKNYAKISSDKTTVETVAEDTKVVKKPIKAPVEKKSEVKTGKVIDCDSLNVRSKSSTSSDVLCVIPKGTTVKITSEDNDWYAVTINDSKGYCMKRYISIV